MKKKSVIILLIVFTVFLGFFREYIFVSINQRIEAGSSDVNNLLKMKWILTVAFSVSYLILTCFFIHYLFHAKMLIWAALLLYAFLFVIALISGAIGYIFFSFESVYPFIRTILGVAQSPIVLLILLSAGYLSTSFTNK